MNTLGGAWNGLKSGAMTGGLLGGFGAATSSVTNSAARHVLDTVGETAVDTIVDAAQGGQVTPGSIVTSLAFNAVTEGITSKVGKGAKADVNTNKPKSGDVPVTKSRQSSTPVQQLSNPGPNKSRIPVEFTDVNGNKSFGEVLDADYVHTRPVKDVTSTTSTAQKRISGPNPNTFKLEYTDQSHFGNYRPERPLPRDTNGQPLPDVSAPHTQIGTKSGRRETYTQAREWVYDEGGNLVVNRDVDFTDHGRPSTHHKPHQHDYIDNVTGGTRQRLGERALELP